MTVMYWEFMVFRLEVERDRQKAKSYSKTGFSVTEAVDLVGFLKYELLGNFIWTCMLFYFPWGKKSLEKLENLEIVRFLPDKNWMKCIMNAQSQPSSQAHHNSFCFWADWNALIFGIHVQKENTLCTYFQCPGVIIYAIRILYAFYR